MSSSKGKSLDDDYVYVEEEVEYSYEDKDWFTTFKKYEELHEALFSDSHPYAKIMHALVHRQTWPRDEDIRCALNIIEGNSEEALGLLPLDPGQRREMLLLACVAGDSKVSRALLVDPEFHITMQHLQAAIDTRDWDIVEQLLATKDLDDYMDLEEVLREGVPGDVLENMERGTRGGCVIL